MNCIKNIALIIFLLLFPTSSYASGTIVLLIDVSSSIDESQMALQIDSYAKSMKYIQNLRFVDIEVIMFDNFVEHISSGNYEAAYESFLEYDIVAPEFRGATCLTDALEYTKDLIPSLKQPVIIDISGDGEANCESDYRINEVLDSISDMGVRINTLFINNTDSNPKSSLNPRKFYESLVRNGGFSIEANGFQDFELALYEKLILEVSSLLEK